MQIVKQWIGFDLDTVNRKETYISTIGGLFAIILVVTISQQAIQLEGSSMLIASMGASAVLLFAVPKGPLSQPWPVLAGHTLSALIGVTCAKYIPDSTLAAGCAVGLAIGAMHQFKCIHPPGGATALTAVIGGTGVSALGYSFVVSPVLLNALSIVVVAVFFNSLFNGRRYPAGLNPPAISNLNPPTGQPEPTIITLRSLDGLVDVTDDELKRLVDLLKQKQSAVVRHHPQESELA